MAVSSRGSQSSSVVPRIFPAPCYSRAEHTCHIN
jgi:hypothetical protein